MTSVEMHPVFAHWGCEMAGDGGGFHVDGHGLEMAPVSCPC